MNNKIVKSVLLLVAVMLVAVVGFPQSDAAAQDIISGNLFENGSFEGGYFNQDSIPQIAVPNGWRMHWLDGVAFDGTDGQVAYRPETVVWYIEDAPPAERSLFFRDGSYTLKLFKPWAPLLVALSQEVSGLEVGRNYRIVAPIYVDIVESYEGGKQPPSARPDAGFIRFSVGPTGSGWRTAGLTYSPTWGANNVSGFYLNSINYIWDFTATSESMIIFLEMGSKIPYVNSGFFMDGVGLYALGTTGEVPVSSGGSGPHKLVRQQPHSPRPHHAQTGPSSMWLTLAIRSGPLRSGTHRRLMLRQKRRCRSSVR